MKENVSPRGTKATLHSQASSGNGQPTGSGSRDRSGAQTAAGETPHLSRPVLQEGEGSTEFAEGPFHNNLGISTTEPCEAHFRIFVTKASSTCPSCTWANLWEFPHLLLSFKSLFSQSSFLLQRISMRGVSLPPLSLPLLACLFSKRASKVDVKTAIF